MSSDTLMNGVPDIELEVGDDAQDARPEGGVTDWRSWMARWASPIAPDRLEVELECARIPERDWRRRCVSPCWRHK